MIRRLAIAAAIVCAATPVLADSKSEAILLFDQGIKEMKAGNFAKACKSFEDSNARIPDSGTKGSLAKCYEKLGKLASSWVLWRELADTAPTNDLRRDAAAQAAKLEPKVPKYVVKVTGPTPRLTLVVNGRPAGVTEMPVPIDAGPVVAIASAQGYVDWKGETTATEGGTVVIEIPALVAAKVDIVGPEPKKPIVVDASKRKKRQLVGTIITGAGVAAIVVGGVFGAKARSKFADAKKTCGGSIDDCFADRVAEAQGQVDDARSAANLSSIMFGGGGALVVTGAIIILTAPAAEKRGVALAPIAAPRTAGLSLSGRF
ncbi:MAG: hypothetical protein ABI867_16830 [Kofleriaceae bacterium]